MRHHTGSLAFGPREPAYVSQWRDAYYQRRGWLLDLEERITRTETGMRWLYRVKRIGLR